MKARFFLFLFLPLFSLAQNKGFTITGTVAGVADGQVKITSTQNAEQVLATGTIKNGVISVKGSVQEPALYWLVLGREQPRYIFLENNAITLNGSKKDWKNIRVEGSANHKDFQKFEQTFTPLLGELNALAAQLQKATTQKGKDAMMQRYDSVVKKVQAEVDAYVTEKKNSYVSPFLIYVTAQLAENPMILEGYYNKLTPTIQGSMVGRSLRDFIAASKVGAIGTDALDFTQADTAGQAVSLSSFRGKYVLVDFWASWCRPCRAENPNVVRVYQKFKNKNFTVLGVSLDDQKEAWLKAIEKDKLSWTHVSDLQQWNNAVARLYRAQSIPQNLLIDPNGKIVAKDLRGEDLERKLCEFLGCN